MCGITGILHFDARPVSPHLLARMNGHMVHRGPDDAGIWQQGPVGLAMRRLSIIDRVHGHQPLCNEDETMWIVFNGEIYNFPELRQQLQAKGHQFRTNSDTETIVHAYEEWGESCPEHLHGMFAFAIYDARDRTLFLARDRAGEKPLLYTVQGKQFIFASEFAALLAHPDVAVCPQPEALHAYMATTVIPAPLTAYQNIYKLPPAHTLTVRNGQVKLRCYWNLEEFFQPERKLKISEADAVDELRHRLEEAVRMRMVSEVALGAFLSGGIDSSAVVAFMSRLSTQPVRTFSIGFEENDYSELPHARRVSQKYGTEHTEVVVRPDAVSILPKLVRHYGEPFADSSALPSFYLSQMTRRHVTVALAGDGADELFAGYTRFRAMQLTEKIPRSLLRLSASLAVPLLGGNDFRSRSARLKRLMQAASLPPDQRYLQWVSAGTTAGQAQLYTPEFTRAIASMHPHPVVVWMRKTAALDIVDACLLTDSMTYLPDDLLVKVDIASMANSVETRLPFLDHPLMEWAARLPQNFKLRGQTTKYILRKALDGLVPIENMQRAKMGFGVPIGRWFRGEMREMLCDTVLSKRALARGYFRPVEVERLVQEHLRGQGDHAFRLWSLLMLELWHGEFVDASRDGRSTARGGEI